MIATVESQEQRTVELWTAARAAAEIGVSAVTAQKVARQHIGDGVSRVGIYLLADADWWRANLVRRRLPDDLQDEIRRLAASGLSGYEIARRLGISQGAAYYHAQNGIAERKAARRRRLQDILATPGLQFSERDAEIIRMLADGATLQQAGDAFGLTRERVRQIAERALSGTYRHRPSRSQAGEQAQLDALRSQIGVRAANALWRAGYRTREQIAALSDADLLRLRGFGMRCLLNVRLWLVAGVGTESEDESA